MIRVRQSLPRDGARLVEIWRSAVGAIDDFVSPADRAAIDREVQGFLPSSEVSLAVDHNDEGVAFMGWSDGAIDSLFVHGLWRGTGVGRRLVQLAMASSETITVDVNEANSQAVGFYRHLGFAVVARSANDGAGRPYPLLHMRFSATPRASDA